MRPIGGGPAERQSDGPRGQLLDEFRVLERIYGRDLADHGQMVRELRWSANRLTGCPLQRDCRQWAYLPSHPTAPAGTITWRRASFTDLTRTAKATCVRKARRQGGWRRAGLAASSASPRSQSGITLQS